MKKIIIAFDNLSFSESALDFAVKLNETEQILLVGAFLPQSAISALWSYAETVPVGMLMPLMEQENLNEVKKHIDIFSRVCENNNIDFRIHEDFNDFSIQELIRESRFADLVIIGGDGFYQKAADKVPNAFVKDVLHRVECPVLLFPEKALFPENILLAYDGSADSVLAIKSFAYLFNKLISKPAHLVYANNKDDQEFPEKMNIEELVTQHFLDIKITHQAFDPKKFMATWAENIYAPILVAGAYGRSGLSRLFSPSIMNEIITDQKIPLFIAHR